ncbi:MAG: helix-turn-helix transcriptional regulator [Burkholderia sp.]
MTSNPASSTPDGSSLRHDAIERLDGPVLIGLPGGERHGPHAYRLGTREIDWHQHRRGQVFCIESGCVHVRTPHGSWLLPPHRAGWILPGVTHKVSISGALSGWSVAIAPAASRVLLDEIRRAPHEPLHLPMPADRRPLKIARRILAQPHEGRTLEDWAQWAGLSARTLSRLFQAETGTSFAQWRQQARLTLALERPAGGEPIANVADALGYATPSNFIAMFRRAFGDSPAHYFARQREG